jgi:hypothetical protein
MLLKTVFTSLLLVLGHERLTSTVPLLAVLPQKTLRAHSSSLKRDHQTPITVSSAQTLDQYLSDLQISASYSSLVLVLLSLVTDFPSLATN